MIKSLLKRHLYVLFLLIPFGGYAQNIITGKIIAKDDKQPLAGTTVRIKETNAATQTDVLGRFTMEVNPGQTVIISSVGYVTQEGLVGSNKVFNFTLVNNEKALGEIVVTALGIRKERKSLTYSMGEVKSEDIQSKTDIATAIQGKVAGVQITNSGGGAGSSTNIIIRGTSSITGNNQALFVVDGMPVSNAVDNTEATTAGVSYSNRAIDINPEDIETVSVLKGGSAVALYGLQGSNGVILITTKKGQKGKMKVDLSSSVNFDQVSQLPFLQSIYAQGDNGQFTAPDNNPNKRSWGPKLASLRYDGSPDYPYDKHGKLVPYGSPTATDKVPTPYNNVGQFFRTGLTFNNFLALSGGNENSVFRFSLGSERQNAIVPTDYFQRITAKISGETEVIDKLKISGNLSYINSGGRRVQQGSSPQSVMLDLYRTPVNFDNTNGLTKPGDPNQYTLSDGTQRTYRGPGAPGGAYYNNPYFTVNQDPFTDDVNRVLGNINLNYAPARWFGVNYLLGTDVYSDQRTQNYAVNDAGNPTGAVILDGYVSKIINSDLQLLFKKQISPDLRLSLILGNTYYNNYKDERETSGTSFNFPGFVNVGNAQAVNALTQLNRYRVVSYYASMDLDYKRQFFINAAYRIDKSTLLDPANNSFKNPTIGASWVFSELPALKDKDILSFGKLRASFGTSGNEPPFYALGTTLTAVNFNSNNTTGSYDGFTNGLAYPFSGQGGFINGSNLGNPHLRAEKTREVDFGGELGFLKDRITFDMTYYNKAGSDLIIQVPYTSATGYSSKVLNAASMTNKGYEILLTFVPVRTLDLNWTVAANFTRNINKVTNLAVQSVSFGGFTGLTVNAIKDYPNTSFFGPHFLTDGKGHELIEDNPNDPNGTVGYPIAGIQSTYAGNPNPDWTTDITSVLKYKGLRFSALVDIKHGGEVWNGTEGALIAYGRADETLNRGSNTIFAGVNGHTDVNGNPVVTGTPNTTSVPLNQSWYQNNGGGFGAVSTQFVQPAGWVRLRETTLAYRFDSRYFKKGPVKAIEIGVYGRNLLLITKYHGIDPETSLQGAGNAQGLDYFQLPGTKTYGFNLKASL